MRLKSAFRKVYAIGILSKATSLDPGVLEGSVFCVHKLIIIYDGNIAKRASRWEKRKGSGAGGACACACADAWYSTPKSLEAFSPLGLKLIMLEYVLSLCDENHRILAK
jgi:hypothetical protein